MSLVALAMTTGAEASKPVKVPTLKDLATVWVGGSEFNAEYLRLDLTESGTGLLTIQYLRGNPARAYDVTGTTLQKYRVTFELRPAEPDAEPIYLRGEAIPGRLELEVGGTSGEWKRPVVLAPLSVLMEQVEAVSKRAQGMREARR